MSDLAKIKAVPDKGVFRLNLITVIKYVSENDGMIGVIGVNWLTQPLPDMQKYVDNVASVKGI
jgi:phosphate transport system substrate-binding protein